MLGSKQEINVKSERKRSYEQVTNMEEKKETTTFLESVKTNTKRECEAVLEENCLTHVLSVLTPSLEKRKNKENEERKKMVEISLNIMVNVGIKLFRSEERRVGKECDYRCISRWSPYH
jgi:hypothetical protein